MIRSLCGALHPSTRSFEKAVLPFNISGSTVVQLRMEGFYREDGTTDKHVVQYSIDL